MEKAIVQAVQKNWPRPAEVALFEKKSLKAKHRNQVLETFEKNNISIEIIKV
jgi:D-tyrosyl-tRNA(Tyr) deacylase